MALCDPEAVFKILKSYHSEDGLSVQNLMDSKEHGGLTFNDFLVLPGKIDFHANMVSTETKVTKHVVLKTPFLSSPMDTVTEDEMAISMAVSLTSSTRGYYQLNFCIAANGRYRCYPP
jgi:IMP dehydrogenase